MPSLAPQRDYLRVEDYLAGEPDMRVFWAELTSHE